jgi:hypothetical protein
MLISPKVSVESVEEQTRTATKELLHSLVLTGATIDEARDDLENIFGSDQVDGTVQVLSALTVAMLASLQEVDPEFVGKLVDNLEDGEYKAFVTQFLLDAQNYEQS